MSHEAQTRSHSPRDPSPQPESGDVKKRKKSKSGKEKQKRRRLDALKEDADAVIARNDCDDSRAEGRNKKRAKIAAPHEENLRQSPSNSSRDATSVALDKKKKKKRRKGLHQPHRGDDQPSVEAIKSPSKCGESARSAAGEEGAEHVQSDQPDANRVKGENLFNANDTTKHLQEPPSSPDTPDNNSSNPAPELSHKHPDRKLTANSKEKDPKKKEKDPKKKEKAKKKKKRRKSELPIADSGIEPDRSPGRLRESAQRAVEKRDVPEQSKIPHTNAASDAPSAEPTAAQPSTEKRSKRPFNATIEASDYRADGTMALSSNKQDSKGANATAEQSNQPEDDEKPLDDERLPRTLFVGNVPQTMTRKQLRKIFSEYSSIESIRIRNVIAANPKIPKKAALLAGRLAKFADSFSAYVVFKETPDIEDVLQRAVDGTNMTILEDHHLRVTKALQTKGKRRQSVFVGNLPFDCKDEELITAFMPVAKECGINLTNVRVNRDSDTGVGRGCGFVTFDDIMGIQACLNKAGEIKIRNRAVRLERAFKTKNMKSKSYKRKWKSTFGQRGQ